MAGEGTRKPGSKDSAGIPGMCAMPRPRLRPLPEGLASDRAGAILSTRANWANGHTIHYYFFDGERGGGRDWKGRREEVNLVRGAFQRWKDVGIGLSFEEVGDPEDAEVRISFNPSNRSWSYVGRDVLNHRSPEEATMNFGWPLEGSEGEDTALHEIGHTLGLPHEHQNPNAGIVWNEAEVLRHFSGPLNYWDEQTIRHNILSKQDPRMVTGSDWDPDSVMHYPFGEGLVLKPEDYARGIRPAGGLSKGDREWIARFYPAGDGQFRTLAPHKSEFVHLSAGEQAGYLIEPTETRKHRIQLFGAADAVLVLFELRDGQGGGDATFRFIAGEDDAGDDRNGVIRARLERGKRYVLRVLMQFAPAPDAVSLMAY